MAELQGIYGQFTFPEKLLQRIWAEGEFDYSSLFLSDGRGLRLLNRGRWNGLSGPDFLGAVVEIDGRRLEGDIEIHLYPEDWEAHGHAANAAYGQVVLHVCLFAGSTEFSLGKNNVRIPVLGLLPYLLEDLESYAASDAVSRLAGQGSGSQLQMELERMQRGTDKINWLDLASKRWNRKREAMVRLVTQEGWENACHLTALDVLGYRFNRGVMRTVAREFPLADWQKSPEQTARQAWLGHAGEWTTRGVRPANHPKLRLEQYAKWAKTAGDWPETLALLIKSGGIVESSLQYDGMNGQRIRPRYFSEWRQRILQSVCHETMGGTRFDTWVVNAVLPMLADQDAAWAEHLWLGWYPGDYPKPIGDALKQAHGGEKSTLTNGQIQAVLEWLHCH